MENLAFHGVDTVVLNYTDEHRATSGPRGKRMQQFSFSSSPQSFHFGHLTEYNWAPSQVVNIFPQTSWHWRSGEEGRHFCHGVWKHGSELGSCKVRHDLLTPREHSELRDNCFFRGYWWHFLVYLFSFALLVLSVVQNQAIKKCNKGKEFCSLQQQLPDL